MKILVTGGAGFIGGNFVHYMVNRYPEDMIVNQDNFEVRTEATDYHAVLEALKAAGYDIAESEVEFIPSMESKVDDESAIKALHKLIDTLDDNDDVQRVSYNCDLPDME